MSTEILRDHNGDIIKVYLCTECHFGAHGMSDMRTVPRNYADFSTCVECHNEQVYCWHHEPFFCNVTPCDNEHCPEPNQGGYRHTYSWNERS